MKRILAAVLISFVFLFIYMAVMTYLYIHNSQNGRWVTNFAYPIALPKVVYYSFFQPTAEEFQIESSKAKFLSAIFFITNVLLYSLPIYGLLTLFSKRQKSKLPSTEPPYPPTFDD
ncbi:MAG TPA: hypothetical protein VNB22_18035 [Pyrinomonadaceae bacterium]|jgi:hypothetical protein|nr:hypothetical protein [Pyrinomonadaceae bacterium]